MKASRLVTLMMSIGLSALGAWGCSSGSSGGGGGGTTQGAACTTAGAAACGSGGTLLLSCSDMGGTLRWAVAKDCSASGRKCEPDPNDPGDFHCGGSSSGGATVGEVCQVSGGGACNSDGTLLLSCSNLDGTLRWAITKDCSASGRKCEPDPNDPGDFHCA